jgi:hypothetical protein
MPELMIAHRTVLSARRSLTKTRELRNLRRARRRDQAVPSGRSPTRTVSVSHYPPPVAVTLPPRRWLDVRS